MDEPSPLSPLPSDGRGGTCTAGGVPRVVPRSPPQPWAGGRNPVGIEIHGTTSVERDPPSATLIRYRVPPGDLRMMPLVVSVASNSWVMLTVRARVRLVSLSKRKEMALVRIAS